MQDYRYAPVFSATEQEETPRNPFTPISPAERFGANACVGRRTYRAQPTPGARYAMAEYEQEEPAVNAVYTGAWPPVTPAYSQMPAPVNEADAWQTRFATAGMPPVAPAYTASFAKPPLRTVEGVPVQDVRADTGDELPEYLRREHRHRRTERVAPPEALMQTFDGFTAVAPPIAPYQTPTEPWGTPVNTLNPWQEEALPQTGAIPLWRPFDTDNDALGRYAPRYDDAPPGTPYDPSALNASAVACFEQDENAAGAQETYAEPAMEPYSTFYPEEPRLAAMEDAPLYADVPAESAPPQQPPRVVDAKAPTRPGALSTLGSAVKSRLSDKLRAVNPWRALWLCVSAVALVVCLVEGAKLIDSLWRNEREMRDARAAYLEQEGQPLERNASRVELLPPGQTYVPTATPVPVQTPKPTARIQQNDPLIGVLDDGGQTDFQAALPTPTVAMRTRQSQYPDNPLLNLDPEIAELMKENPDVVGRLTIDGLLDETVVQSNNTYYLTHNAHGTMSTAGAVFVDESCALRRPPENLILRGQSACEGKLFAELAQYGAGDTTFIQQHAVIRMVTQYERAEYVVFAIIHADSRTDHPEYFNYAGYASFQSDEQMMRYVEAARAHSVAKINVDVQPSDRLLTLATLGEGSDAACWVVLARMKRATE